MKSPGDRRQACITQLPYSTKCTADYHLKILKTYTMTSKTQQRKPSDSVTVNDRIDVRVSPELASAMATLCRWMVDNKGNYREAAARDGLGPLVCDGRAAKHRKAMPSRRRRTNTETT